MRPMEREWLSEQMARLADGDRAAFDPLFDRLWPVLTRFAIRLLGDEASGEDAAQQALLNIFARAHEYESGRDALSWALGITHWECRTRRRQRQRNREDCMPAPPERLDLSTDPEREAVARDLEQALHAAVGQLGDTDRDVLLADLRGETVCARPATVRKRRQRAVERLRAAWKVIHGTK